MDLPCAAGCLCFLELCFALSIITAARNSRPYPMGRPRRKTALALDHTLQSSEIDTCLLESLLDLDIHAVFLILRCYVSQGLRSDTETRDVAGGWAEFRPLWPKQMTCLACVITYTKYSKLLRRTPSSSPQHILLPSGDVHCGLKKNQQVVSSRATINSSICSKSGRSRGPSLRGWWLGKCEILRGEKLLGEEGKTLILKPGPPVLSVFIPFQD